MQGLQIIVSNIMWKYLQDRDVAIGEYAEMSWHKTLAIVASSSKDLREILPTNLELNLQI